MIVAEVLVLLIGVSVIAPLPLAVTPLKVPLTDELHAYVVPTMLDVGVKFNDTPLQISCTKDEAEVVITGRGFTVTVTSNGEPEQPFACGVMRYTTVPALMPSVLVNACVIALPTPALAPVTLLVLCTSQL